MPGSGAAGNLVLVSPVQAGASRPTVIDFPQTIIPEAHPGDGAQIDFEVRCRYF
jgi:hypothetical protein